jgi:hypothetical protein
MGNNGYAQLHPRSSRPEALHRAAHHAVGMWLDVAFDELGTDDSGACRIVVRDVESDPEKLACVWMAGRAMDLLIAEIENSSEANADAPRTVVTFARRWLQEVQSLGIVTPSDHLKTPEDTAAVMERVVAFCRSNMASIEDIAEDS